MVDVDGRGVKTLSGWGWGVHAHGHLGSMGRSVEAAKRQERG